MLKKILTDQDVQEIKELYVKFNDFKSQEASGDILKPVERLQVRYFNLKNLDKETGAISKLSSDELDFLNFLEGLIVLFNRHDETLRNLANR